MDQIEPRTLKGFRDFLPGPAQVRLRAIETIRSVFQQFGFLPLETPTLEYADVLTGKYGDEGDKLMYRFKDQGGRDVAMRYDLTVPLARVVAQYADLPKPFRRYQIAPVWRADNTQKGRYREFWQCDADVVGSSSMLADAEMVLLYEKILTALGIKNFQIKVNNRKVLEGIIESVGIPEEERQNALRWIDKWEKVGEKGVQAEFSRVKYIFQKDKLFSLLGSVASWESQKQLLRSELRESLVGMEGLQELDELNAILDASSLKTGIIDLTLARGLDYYTGTIFEVVLPDKPEFGSVGGGGRYDGLIGRFTGKDMPAVGMSVGLDRLLAAMSELGLEQGSRASAKVFVALLDEDLRTETFQLVNELRSAGIPSEMSYEATKLDKQLKYADKLGIQFAVLYGKKEQEAGTMVLKDLEKREQKEVARSALLQELQS